MSTAPSLVRYGESCPSGPASVSISTANVQRIRRLAVADEWHHDASIPELVLNILEVLVVGKATVDIGLSVSVLIFRL